MEDERDNAYARATAGLAGGGTQLGSDEMKRLKLNDEQARVITEAFEVLLWCELRLTYEEPERENEIRTAIETLRRLELRGSLQHIASERAAVLRECELTNEPRIEDAIKAATEAYQAWQRASS